MHFTYLKSKSFLLPTAAVILYAAVMLTLLGSGERKYGPLWRTLSQWDGQHYLSIAQSGYDAFPCPDNPEWICGNVGWFPLYPIAARVLGWILGPIGLEMHTVVLVTSFVFFWFALLVLYKLISLRYSDTAAAGTLAALLLFPSSFYFLTAFPYALFLLLAVTVFLLLEKEHYLACALPAGLLAVTYPSGITIAVPLLWILLSRWRHLTPSQRYGLAASIAATGVALVLYGLYYRLHFDDFFLYVHFQSKPYYAHEAALPFIPIADSLLNLPPFHPVRLILLFVGLALLAFYTRRVPASWQTFMWSVLLFTPSAGTTDCYYRHITVAFPLYVMIGLSLTSRHRRWLFPACAVVSIILMWAIYLRTFKLGALV